MKRWMRNEQIFIWAMVGVLIILFGLALYGYLSGGWESPNT